MKYKNKYKPDLNILFLNSLAHAQHKAWNKIILVKILNSPLKTIDMIFGMLLNQLDKKDAILILNGLGQENVDGADYYIYRQINPEDFIKDLGLKYHHLEQCMTNESHIFFKSKEELDKAFIILEEANVNGNKFFYVERDKYDPNKLFYQIDYFKLLGKDTKLSISNKELCFYKYFAILARRTGAHSPFGKAYYKNINIKKSLYNHEICGEILSFFRN